MSTSRTVLGVDIGTTHVKCVVLESGSGGVLCQSGKAHDATVSGLPNGHHEQSVEKIVDTVKMCVDKLNNEDVQRVHKVAVTGQMHGILFWDNSNPLQKCTNLITWMDKRCEETLLQKLSQFSSQQMSTGYGFSSLFWLLRKKMLHLEDYNRCGTVMDFLVSLLCKFSTNTISAHNAFSWGFYDMDNGCWQIDRLKSLGLPDSLQLPLITPLDQPVGQVADTSLGIPIEAAVYPAWGDFQASFYAADELACAVLNVGTSSILAFSMPTNGNRDSLNNTTSVQVWPYKRGRQIAVAASLNGGNVLTAFAQFMADTTTAVTGRHTSQSDPDVWSAINEALNASDAIQSTNQAATTLRIVPTIFGERHDQSATGSIHNITPDSLNLKQILHSMVDGIIANLVVMMPLDLLQQNGVSKLRICGQATQPYYKRAIQRHFRDFVIEEVDCKNASALGVAKFHC